MLQNDYLDNSSKYYLLLNLMLSYQESLIHGRKNIFEGSPLSCGEGPGERFLAQTNQL